MNPGLPGLGIGGLFYILSALAMPLVALLRAARGAPRETVRWTLALRQCLIALSIVVTMSAVFWALDLALLQPLIDTAAHWQAVASEGWQRHMVRVSAVLTTAGVLAFVLLLMQLARLVSARHGAAARSAAASNAA